MPNVPGGLVTSVAEPLARAGINLEYFYAFVQSEAGNATVVLKVNDLDRAEKILENRSRPPSPIEVLPQPAGQSFHQPAFLHPRHNPAAGSP